MLPFVRFSWGGREGDPSCVTSQTVVPATQAQVLPQLSGADAGHCSACWMLSAAGVTETFLGTRLTVACEDPAVPWDAPALGRFSEPPGLIHPNHGEKNPRGGLPSAPYPVFYSSGAPLFHQISKIRHSSLFHLYACLRTGFGYENGALSRG